MVALRYVSPDIERLRWGSEGDRRVVRAGCVSAAVLCVARVGYQFNFTQTFGASRCESVCEVVTGVGGGVTINVVMNVLLRVHSSEGMGNYQTHRLPSQVIECHSQASWSHRVMFHPISSAGGGGARGVGGWRASSSPPPLPFRGIHSRFLRRRPPVKLANMVST